MKIEVVKATGRWLCLAGLLLMITGDSPRSIPVIRAPWLYLVLLLLGSLCFAAGGLKPRRIPGVAAVVKPLALLLGAFLLSTVASSNPILSAQSFLAVLTIVAAGWVFVSLIEDERFRHAIGPVVAIAVLLLAVRIIVWRYEEGLLTEAYHVGNNAWRGKIQLTWVLNLFAPLLLAWAVTAQKRRLAAFYSTTWVVIGAALYFLQARMGLIVFATTAAGVLMFTLNQWRRALAVVIVAAAIGVTLIGRTTELAHFFVSTIADPAVNPGIDMRLGIWKDTIRLIQSRPFLGHGLGTYDAVAYTLENTTAVPLYRGAGWHAHNMYLHVLAETGLVGLVAWCYLWLSILGQIVGAWNRAAPFDRPPLLGVFWGISAFLMLSLTEVMIAARVYASFRMNLTLAFLVAFGLAECSRSRPEAGLYKGRG